MTPTPNINRWHVRTEDGIAGPYTLDQLRSMVRQNTIDRHTPIRTEGASNWIRAGQYPAVFSSFVESVQTPAKPAAPAPIGLPPQIPRAPDSKIAKAYVLYSVIAGVTLAALVVAAVFLMPTAAQTESPSQSSPAQSSSVAAGAKPKEAKQSNDTTVTTAGALSANPSLATKSSYSTEELVALTEHAVVTVLTVDGVGSGFVIAKHLVATNYHVVADDAGDRINCFFPSAPSGTQGPFAAQLVAEDPRADLALLRIEPDVKPMELTSSSVFRRGQDVIAIGTPALFNGRDILPNAITRGVVSAQHELFGQSRYQLSMAINPGNSGGPVIGLDGKVVGVVVSKSKSEEGIGFCVPASSLKKLLDEQSSNNSSAMEKVRSEHLARLTARELVNLTLDLERFLVQLAAEVEKRSGSSTKQLSAVTFVELLNRLIAEINPGIKKNFSSQLGDIVSDDNLSPRLRSELRTLLERHLALHAALANPTGSVQGMMSTIANLRERFLEQLRKVDTTLPLGIPELIE